MVFLLFYLMVVTMVSVACVCFELMIRAGNIVFWLFDFWCHKQLCYEFLASSKICESAVVLFKMFLSVCLIK